MLTWTFWKQAIERAIKTAAQTAAALLGVAGLGILDVDWKMVGSVVGLAVVASLLTSIGSSSIGESTSPSAVPTEPAPAAKPEPAPAPVVEPDADIAAAPAPAGGE